jgi:hypothetical protein
VILAFLKRWIDIRTDLWIILSRNMPENDEKWLKNGRKTAK